MIQISRTDYDRLVDIGVSNLPSRLHYCTVGAAHNIELPSKDVSRCTLLYQIDMLRNDMI